MEAKSSEWTWEGTEICSVSAGSSHFLVHRVSLIGYNEHSIGKLSISNYSQSLTVVPAIATTAYTLSTINNAFESDLNPMIGFLDSHVSL